MEGQGSAGATNTFGARLVALSFSLHCILWLVNRFTALYRADMTRTGRPTKGGQAVYVRFSEETIEALDARLEELRAERPGMSGITRSDLIRDLVTQALGEQRPARKGARR